MRMWMKSIFALTALVLVSGCEVVTTERHRETVRQKDAALNENEDLHGEVSQFRAWKSRVMQFENHISALDDVIGPIAPLAESNKELMEQNAREGEEVGGGSTGEVFYLVPSAYAELDKRAAALASGISNHFGESDLARSYLLKQLQDQVCDTTIGIADTTLRRSQHMATDRRLATARLKAINECFLALRNLSQSEIFDLSYAVKQTLIQKLDQLRAEYAKTLKSDFFPAIPHFVPLASGKDYLKVLADMNEYIVLASVFYNNPSKADSDKVRTELDADLTKKVNALKQAN